MSIKRTSGKRAMSGVNGLIRHVPALALGIAMTACAHTPSGSLSPASPSKEPDAMNAPATDAYRPHTLDEFPDLTPEEIGRRFLKLIDSLKTSNDLTLGKLQEVMQLRLIPTPGASSAFFNMYLPNSGWYYNVVYYDDPQLHRKNASYNFLSDARDQVHEKGLPDISPVCGIDFNAYVTELKKIGFVEREDLAQYESPMPIPLLDPETLKETGFPERKFFRIPTYVFSRGNTGVMIRERREADAPDEKLHHACVESISVSVED